MSEHVNVSDEGGIRTVRMNRPDKKNALTMAMYDVMTNALESASASDAVRCILIAGVPGAFSAGNDMGDFLAATQGTGRWSAQALRFLPALVHCKKPLVAAVSGVAVACVVPAAVTAVATLIAPVPPLDVEPQESPLPEVQFK